MDPFRKALEDSLAAHRALLERTELHDAARTVAGKIVGSLQRGGRVLFCGNGGSAADAQHLAAELSGRFYFDRPPLDAEALHVNTSYVTAVANDCGYDEIFARLVRAKGRRGDVLVGLSTSGNSANVVAALEVSRGMGITTIGMTGANPGRMGPLSDHLLRVPADITTRIQELHILVGHTICELVEAAMFGQPAS